MKKILFFLTGFLISLFSVSISYSIESAECFDCLRSYAANNCNGAGCSGIAGFYLTQEDAHAAATAGGLVAYSGSMSTGCSDCTNGGGILFYYTQGGTPYYKWYVYNMGGENADTDGDGLNDNVDPYPEDPSPFAYRIVSQQKDKLTGDILSQLCVTPDGEYFTLGDDSECTPETCQSYLYIGSTWLPSTDIGNTNYDSVSNNTGTEAGQTIQDILNQDQIPDTGQASGTNAGTTSSGSETDNEALRAIQDNTAITTANQERMADYLHSINNNLSDLVGVTATKSDSISSGSESVDVDMSGVESRLDSIQSALGTTEQQQTAANNMESAMAQFDEENFDYENSGERTALESDIASMSSDGTLNTLISENTQGNTALDNFKNSGITVTSADPIVSMDLGPMGIHDIDFSLPVFQSFYSAIAAFLYPFSILLSYFIILRR